MFSRVFSQELEKLGFRAPRIAKRFRRIESLDPRTFRLSDDPATRVRNPFNKTWWGTGPGLRRRQALKSLWSGQAMLQ